MNEIQIAEIAHEANRAYCKTIGDASQLAWPDAPMWQRDSAVAGVRLHLANPDASPSDSHDSWMKEKLRDGWKHGPIKNPDSREHPCMVPYNMLPEEQKAKDYLFRGVVHALAVFVK